MSSDLWLRIKNPASPYVRFFYSALKTALFLFAMVMLVRALAWSFFIIDTYFPLQDNPPDIQTYLPFSTTRVISTVLDIAAILTFVIVEAVQMIKLIIEVRRELTSWRLYRFVGLLTNQADRYSEEEILNLSRELQKRLSKVETEQLGVFLSKAYDNE